MKISVITATYNSAATIVDTLDSVASQTHSDTEHIIVDGVSKDDTVELVRKHGQRVSKLVSERDRGIYDAMNNIAGNRRDRRVPEFRRRLRRRSGAATRGAGISRSASRRGLWRSCIRGPTRPRSRRSLLEVSPLHRRLMRKWMDAPSSDLLRAPLRL